MAIYTHMSIYICIRVLIYVCIYACIYASFYKNKIKFLPKKKTFFQKYMQLFFQKTSCSSHFSKIIFFLKKKITHHFFENSWHDHLSIILFLKKKHAYRCFFKNNFSVPIFEKLQKIIKSLFKNKIKFFFQKLNSFSKNKNSPYCCSKTHSKIFPKNHEYLGSIMHPFSKKKKNVFVKCIFSNNVLIYHLSKK